MVFTLVGNGKEEDKFSNRVWSNFICLGEETTHSPEDLDLLSGCVCVSLAAVTLKMADLSFDVSSW